MIAMVQWTSRIDAQPLKDLCDRAAIYGIDPHSECRCTRAFGPHYEHPVCKQYQAHGKAVHASRAGAGPNRRVAVISERDDASDLQFECGWRPSSGPGLRVADGLRCTGALFVDDGGLHAKDATPLCQ